MSFADRDRLESILACTRCGGELSRVERGPEFACADCDAGAHEVGQCFVFPSEQLPEDYARPEYTSCNPYTWDALQLIEDESDGLVVDLGAGQPGRDFPNVVQVELRKYRGTDVVFAEGRLPFADASVDGVISLSVLEHVRDPFRYVAEVRRVLRPGARCVAHAAFLQPEHGAPCHYFNMTRHAFEELFDAFEVESLRSGPHQHPWLALHWFLRSYLEGMSAEDREAFRGQGVGELFDRLERLTHERTRIKQDDDVFEISRRLFRFNEEHAEPLGPLGRIPLECVDELAAGFAITARKPG